MSFLVTVVIFPFLQWSSNSNEQVIQFNDFNKIDLYESNFFVICLCQYQIILQICCIKTPHSVCNHLCINKLYLLSYGKDTVLFR